VSVRPELLALAADLEAHLGRTAREVEEIDELKSPAPPDKRTLWALAGHLQALYTGWETVMTRALERFEGLPPAGPDSHVRIIQAAVLDIPGVRPAILYPQTAVALQPYRAFRHFFRHAYGAELDWERMAAKVEDAARTSERFRQDVLAFCAFLRSAAAA
jgi:hypothetical protein